MLRRSTSKAVITEGDLSYLGSFLLPVSVSGADAQFGKGFTHRYVDGQLHFLASAWNPQTVYEMTAPALVSNPTLANTATVLQTWGQVAAVDLDTIGGHLHGLHWDETSQRLYWTGGSIYNTTSPRDPSIGYADLNGDGTFTAHGIWGLTDYSCKMAMGGVTPIPSWFADLHCPGKSLGAGFGGYFSIAEVGPDSMGPALTAFDPTTFGASGTSVAHTPLVNYPFQAFAYTDDRCHRDTDYHSEFDDWNPQGGTGYWSWTDTLWQSGVWVDTPTKTGFMCFAILGNGRTWYESSNLHAERGTHLWLVYDPTDLATVAHGTSDTWAIQPANSWLVEYAGISYPLAGWTGEPGQIVVGSTFDAVTGRLYLLIRFAITIGSNNPQVVYVYQLS